MKLGTAPYGQHIKLVPDIESVSASNLLFKLQKTANPSKGMVSLDRTDRTDRTECRLRMLAYMYSSNLRVMYIILMWLWALIFRYSIELNVGDPIACTARHIMYIKPGTLILINTLKGELWPLVLMQQGLRDSDCEINIKWHATVMSARYLMQLL